MCVFLFDWMVYKLDCVKVEILLLNLNNVVVFKCCDGIKGLMVLIFDIVKIYKDNNNYNNYKNNDNNYNKNNNKNN